LLQPQWAKYNEKPKNCIVGDIFLQLFNRYCTIYVEKQDLLNIIDNVSLPSRIMKIINVFLTTMLPDDREPVMDNSITTSKTVMRPTRSKHCPVNFLTHS